MNALRKKQLITAVKVIGAVVFALIMLIPFMWMFSVSFKATKDVLIWPPSLLPKDGKLSSFVGFTNYKTVLNDIPFMKFLVNSVITATAVTAGTIITSTLGGYIFSKYSFKGKNTLFLLILATMMIPFDVIVIPLYLMVRRLGLLNNLLALIIPGLVSAYGIFLCRQFIGGIPDELTQAARIDGCSEFGIYAKIIIPLSGPVIAALGIFTFMGNWDSFLWPLLVIDNINIRTLPLGISIFRSQFGVQKWNVIMASVVLSILPVLLVFMFAQKYFVEGIALSGLKM